MRHIFQKYSDYIGFYRNDCWEYPVIAMCAVMPNTLILRNYLLTGKDFKVPIFGDKVEITCPGKLMSSVDFNDIESGQSDIRNKILSPVFKKLGILEQWGNGLKLIAEELQNYPEIWPDWKEPVITFRDTFTNKNFKQQPELLPETIFTRILKQLIDNILSRKEISTDMGQKPFQGN